MALGFAILLLAGGVAAGQHHHVHRLFEIGELAYYDTAIEVSQSRSAEGYTPHFLRRLIQAQTRIKTAGIREGVATVYLDVEDASVVESMGQAADEPLDPFKKGIVRASVQNSGVVTWDYLVRREPAPVSWLSLAFCPAEWVPPLPDRLLRTGDIYESTLPFPIRAILPEEGWPDKIDVPLLMTFLGVQEKAGRRTFRIHRKCDTQLTLVSSDKTGGVTGSIAASGSYDLDASTGLLVSCDLTWIVHAEITAPAALGGARTVDYVVAVKSNLKRVGRVGEQ
jgi:hypothetical protein